MTRSKVTRPLKLEISKCISSAIFNVSWQMSTDYETMEQYLTFVWCRFLMYVLVFVSRDFELGRVSVQFAHAFAITIPFARRRRRSVATAFWGGDPQFHTGLIFSTCIIYPLLDITDWSSIFILILFYSFSRWYFYIYRLLLFSAAVHVCRGQTQI